MNDKLLIMIAVTSAFILYSGFHASGLQEITIISGIVSGVHFGHFAKVIYKIMKWGLGK